MEAILPIRKYSTSSYIVIIPKHIIEKEKLTVGDYVRIHITKYNDETPLQTKKIKQ